MPLFEEASYIGRMYPRTADLRLMLLAAQSFTDLYFTHFQPLSLPTSKLISERLSSAIVVLLI